MFKKGDKIKCIGYAGDTSPPYVSRGVIYEVLQTDDQRCLILNNGNQKWFVRNDCFKLIKKVTSVPKNEVEWLDRVQENFKE